MNNVANVMVHLRTHRGNVNIKFYNSFDFIRCILTYEVGYSKTGAEGSYVTVTDEYRYKFTTAFVYAPAPQNGNILQFTVLIATSCIGWMYFHILNKTCELKYIIELLHSFLFALFHESAWLSVLS